LKLFVAFLETFDGKQKVPEENAKTVAESGDPNG